ncbi:unnamed protein product [Phaeothamnion confervicola]
MRLLRRQIEKDGAGVVTLCAQEAEDMWHAYNLIQPHDFVKTTTVRKVVNETATGSTTSKRVRLNLTIEVERTEFDSGTCVLRISGRCREENPYVKIGAYHTLALELSQNFDITKPVSARTTKKKWLLVWRRPFTSLPGKEEHAGNPSGSVRRKCFSTPRRMASIVFTQCEC